MGKKRFSQEQIVTPLRQIEVMTGQDNENFYNLNGRRRGELHSNESR
jgi:hypothetical protein